MRSPSSKTAAGRAASHVRFLGLSAAVLLAVAAAQGQDGAASAGPQQSAIDMLRQLSRGPVYVIPGKPEISTLYFDGSQIEIQTEERWKFACGSDLTGVTLEDLIQSAETHYAMLEDGPDVIIDTGQRSGWIDIVYNTSGFPADALDAFAMAEAYLESLFSDDMTVTCSCTYASLPGGVLGSTSSFYVLNVTYVNSRNGLQSGMDADDVIQSWLPSGSTVPVRYNGSSATVTDENRIDWTRANYRATVGSGTGSAGSMQYSSDTNWDWDPTNGVGGTKFSFVDVVTHETGHALGFVSAVDDQDESMEAMDLYRFQRTDGSYDYNPDTYEEFQTTPRLVDYNNPNGEHISDLIDYTYRMCDGYPNQASHFLEIVDAQMDPLISNGETLYPNFYRDADKNMFDAMGYDYPPCVAPNFTIQPDPNQTLCEGEDFSLHVEVDTPGCSYQWRKFTTDLVDDGVHIVGATTDTLYIYDVTLDDASTHYNCRVTDPNDCSVLSDDAELVVDPAPVITDQPDDVVADEGSYADFQITVENSILMNFQWRKDTVPLSDDGHISGSTSEHLYIFDLVPSDAGEYDCVVTQILDPFCVATSDAATLTVNPAGCPNPGDSGNYCTADIDGSGDCIVALNDLAQLLANYGITTGATPDQGDIDPPPDGDGDVDIGDLAALLAQYGDDCN
jgi:hypothetical protein